MLQVELMRCYIGYYQTAGCPFQSGICNEDVATYLERHENAVYDKIFGEHNQPFAAAVLESMVSPHRYSARDG